MRKLFIVVARLLGLQQLCSAIILTSMAAFQLSMIRHFPVSVKDSFGSLGALAVGAPLTLVVCWLLIIKTEWLADKFNINENDNLPFFDNDGVLKIGIKLMGIYIAVLAIPVLVAKLHLYNNVVSVFATVLAVLFRMAIGFLLVSKTEKIIEYISVYGRKAGKT
ncbi:MAG: hypothetical protein J7M11_06260 [Elusimicrobia bacterium]|nr:hypothetical protein [Elusimicrobiota bacterium]